MRLFSEDVVAGFLADGWWTEETWTSHFARNVAERANSVCLVDAPGTVASLGRDPVRLTWAELDAAVDRCAGMFHAHGVAAGDVLGIQIPNSVELVITYLALNRLGAILSPYATAYRRHEIAQLAAIARVRGFVTAAVHSGRDLREDIAAVADGQPGAESIFVWNGKPARGDIPLSLPDVLCGPEPSTQYRSHVAGLRPRPNDCTMIMFTSGTTGVPKGVPRAYGDSMASARNTVGVPGLTSDDVLLNSMPMVNAGSIAGIFLPWLLTGCRLVQHDPFDLHVFAAQIEQERVTYTVVPPTILNDMVCADGVFTAYDLSSLRAVGAGSAPLSGWAISRWEQDHGVEIINFFGSTEGLQLTSDADTVPDPAMRGRCLPLPGSARFAWRTRAGRYGQARLVDLGTGAEITEAGQPGELRVKSASLFSGYLNPVEDPFDEQGYFCTGDIFEFSADAPDLLVHVDRKKDLIIRGGMNISAAEIETLLARHPKVSEVAAVGRKDERLGERTCVFVVPRDTGDPPTLAELIEFLEGERIARFKLPESLELIGKLPRNPSGKVLKHELRSAINASNGRSV
jgi:acyl-CoA synthetase (AMP-forming)/AMP-acid ligase II